MKQNQRKLGVLLSYLSMFLNVFISILYTPVMLRILGQAEYGLYQLAASIVAYLNILNFGFMSAYLRYFSKYKVGEKKEEIHRLNGMFFLIFSGIGLLALVCGGLLTSQADVLFSKSLTAEEITTATILMGILVVNIAIGFPFKVFQAHIKGNEHHFFLKVLDIIKSIATPFVILPLLLLGYGSVGLVAGTTLLTICIELLYMGYALKKLQMKFVFRKFDFTLMKEITLYCSLIGLNIIAEQINWNVDKFLLGMYQGTAAVAVYSIAAQLKGYYLTFSTSISQVFVPQTFQLVARGGSEQEITALVTRIGRIQFLVLSLILGGLVLLGQPFIEKWAGEAYHDAYWVLLVMIFPVIISHIQNLCNVVQEGKNMHKFRAFLYFGIALGNLVISVPLCQVYGPLGCAVGTGLSTLLGHGLMMNLYNHKKVGINMVTFWKEIGLLSRGLILPILIIYTMIHFVDLYQVVNFLSCGFLYVLVFLGSMWFLGMNEYEKTLLRNAVKSMRKKLRI